MIDDDEPTVELDFEVIQTTWWALLVTDGDKQAWLAKSLLRPLNEGVDDCNVGELATFTLPE